MTCKKMTSRGNSIPLIQGMKLCTYCRKPNHTHGRIRKTIVCFVRTLFCVFAQKSHWRNVLMSWREESPYFSNGFAQPVAKLCDDEGLLATGERESRDPLIRYRRCLMHFLYIGAFRAAPKGAILDHHDLISFLRQGITHFVRGLSSGYYAVFCRAQIPICDLCLRGKTQKKEQVY